MSAANTMTYKGHSARVEFDPEDGVFVGHLAGIDDVVGFHADTVSGLIEAFHEAVDDDVATCERIGQPAEKPYSGKVMFRIKPETHARAALAARLSGKSLNQWGEEALAAAANRATA